jgi:hypothetical protein
VICTVKLDEGNPSYAGFGSGKWFWLYIIVHVAMAGEWRQQPCAPAEKSVINMI